MTRDCGHICCTIAGNRYHSHREPPARCERCAWADGDDAPRATGLGPDELRLALAGRVVIVLAFPVPVRD